MKGYSPLCRNLHKWSILPLVTYNAFSMDLSGMFTLVDFQTKEPVTTDTLVFTGVGRPWEVVMDLEEVKKKINLEYFKKTPPFVSKYLPLLPVHDYSKFVSLGEGETPLIRSNVLEREFGASLYFKLEGQNPTGSFKDRGSAVELTVAKECGAKGIVLASTGNMAASCACYAAAARIPCYVFVPEGTPPSKLAQVIAYGGRIIQVRGTYGDAARLAEGVAREYGFYLAGDYAFRVEGGKTAAFELVEQLLYQIPDMVVIPIGCGTNVASYYKGFREYLELGIIDRIPHIIGVQAEAANPVVRAFKQGKREVEPLKEVRSLARAIAINDPLDGMKALDAMYSTQGSCIDLSEEEMVGAQYELSKEEGLFVETSCAASFAALRKIHAKSSLAHKHIVCIMTGTGLKDPDPIIRSAIRPSSIGPTMEEFKELFEKDLCKPPVLHFLSDLETAFSEVKSKEEVSKFIGERLGILLEPHSLDLLMKRIEGSIDKGVSILTSDLKYIIEEIREEEDLSNSILHVKDFSLTSRSGNTVEVSLEMEIRKPGEKTRAETVSSNGVGMVDALFSAFLKVSTNNIICLEDFSVEIRKVVPQGLISVQVVLREGSRTVVSRASALDVIGGSVKAFERGFNKILID
jgi:threonine synthase